MPNYSDIFDNEGLDYMIYRQLIDKLLSQGKTTGPDNSTEMLHYTKMNVQRMKRVEKTIVLTDGLLATIAALKNKYRMLVVTEGWCGDAAQILPIIHIITMAAPEKMELKVVLRDQHLDLIDAHLTNGGRAIPALLILNEDGNLALPKWGPRPQVLHNLMLGWKNEGIEMPELAEKLHGWYAKDRTSATQQELNVMFAQLK